MPCTTDQLVEAYNDIESFPTLKDVAKHLGLAVKTVKNRAAKLRARERLGEEVPELISRAAHTQSVMTEEGKTFMEDWGPAECINELRTIQKEHPDKHITRNFFRANTAITDSTWNRFFGTFQEFRRQAGLELSRSQSQLERHIAKHASVDPYRELSDRSEWGEDYSKDTSGRYKTLLVASDLHDIEVDPFFMRVLLETAKRAQPDGIVLGGDVFDLAEFGKYSVDPRDWNVVKHIKFAHEHILKPLREACPDAFFDMIEGNHEARMLMHLCEKTPAMKVLLADLHGWGVRELLGLDQFEINYIAKADLAGWNKADRKREMSKNFKVYYDCFLVHHFPEGRHFKMPGVCGHHHQHIVWSEFSHTFGSYEYHQLGAGHITDAVYCNGQKWNQGFTLVHIDTHLKLVNFEYVPITMFATVGGKHYYREVDEMVGHFAQFTKETA